MTGSSHHRSRSYSPAYPISFAGAYSSALNGGIKSQSFSFLTSLPSEFTYTRADTVATYTNSSGKLVAGASNTPRFNHTSAGIPLGILIETSRQNKQTNTNVNMTTTTNLTTSGDAAGVLSVVSDATELANANLEDIATNDNVFKIDNTAGSTNFIVTVGGQCGNTNAHSFSCYARVVGGTTSFQLSSGAGSVTINSSGYQRWVSNNVTPDVGTRQVRFVVAAGRTCFFLLNQLEEGAFSTTPIIISGAAATRQKSTLACTTLANITNYSQSQGCMVVETDSYKPPTDVSASHGIMLAEGTGLTNCISVYKKASSGINQTRLYNNSVALMTGRVGSYDSSVTGTTGRYPWGISWINGSIATLINGAGVYENVTLASPFAAAFTRLDLGSRPFTEEICGHVKSLTVYNKYRTSDQIKNDLVKAGEFYISFSGQSNATGPFSSSSTGLNGGELAGKAVVDAVWTSTRNWLVNGATEGTSLRYITGVSDDTNYWVNELTNEYGAPFRRWRTIMQACANGTPKAIVSIAGESDAGGPSKTEYKAAMSALFTTMRNQIGNVPVIIVPLGRNTASDYGGYQTIREAQYEFCTENPSLAYITPERFDLALQDTIHLSDAGNATMMQRLTRKMLSVLGETVSGPVNSSSISSVSRSGATVTVTLSHPSGITDFTPTTGIEGFVFLDNTTSIGISSAVRTNATTITLTLASTPSNTNQTLYYGRNSLSTVTTSNLVKGNDANTLPLRSHRFESTNTGASFSSAY